MPLVRENNLCYVGDTEFALSDSTEPIVDVYGLDSMVRVFEGRNSLLQSFLAQYPVNRQDAQYSGMSVTGKPAIDVKRAFSRVSLQFEGKISNEEPAVKKTDFWQDDSVQIQSNILTPLPSVQLIIDYRAPGTTYSYATKTRPTAPRFENGALALSLGIQIIAKRGAVGLTGTTFGPQLAAMQPEQRLTAFKREQVGLWWIVEESWRWSLVQTKTFFDPIYVTLT